MQTRRIPTIRLPMPPARPVVPVRPMPGAPSALFALSLKSVMSRAPVGTVGGAAARSLPARLDLPSARVGAGGPGAFDALIRETARREGVDEHLVRAVVEAESGFNPGAVSKAGAVGLMQLMPGTARSLGVQDSRDPAANVAGGVKFLRMMLDKFGSVPLALAAYNAGPGAVEKYGGIPPYSETRTYVSRVLDLQQRNSQVAARSLQGGSDGRSQAV